MKKNTEQLLYLKFCSIIQSPDTTPGRLDRATQTDAQLREQTASRLRSTRLLPADDEQIRPRPDYAPAIHFPAAACHMIDLSI